MNAELPIPGEAVGKLPGLLWSDVLIMIGVGVAIAIALILWAIFIRKPKDIKSQSSPVRKEQAPNHSRRKRKHKRKRREHRTRNPSLAETGGLPAPNGPSAEGSTEL